jgi:hypothetical protein
MHNAGEARPKGMPRPDVPELGADRWFPSALGVYAWTWGLCMRPPTDTTGRGCVVHIRLWAGGAFTTGMLEERNY